MAKAKASTTPTAKKKRWCAILAPKAFNQVELGKTYVTEPESAVGRVVRFNLKDITNNLRDQHIYLLFKIIKNDELTLITEVAGYYLTRAAMKRITRRGTRRVDDSFVVVTKDEKRVRIKPLMITIHNTVHSVTTALRGKLRSQLALDVSKLTFTELIQRLTSRQIQNELKKKLSKIYPLKSFEIKIAEFARAGKAEKAGEEIVEEKQTKEVKKVKTPKKSVSEEMVEEMTKARDTESFGEEA
jgi:ribosomal protein S3AE